MTTDVPRGNSRWNKPEGRRLFMLPKVMDFDCVKPGIHIKHFALCIASGHPHFIFTHHRDLCALAATKKEMS